MSIFFHVVKAIPSYNEFFLLLTIATHLFRRCNWAVPSGFSFEQKIIKRSKETVPLVNFFGNPAGERGVIDWDFGSFKKELSNDSD